MTDPDGRRPPVRARTPERDRPAMATDAVLYSPEADDEYERPLCGLDVRIVPDDEVALVVAPEADAERVARLERLVEFDIAMNCRYGSAAAGRCDPSTDDRLCELSACLGTDALRVAERGLLSPRGGGSCPTFG
ncbi:hypothetical protein [Halosegnis marinus]|uniref:Uncharacterized protein n=1 Tax=Halosegnis marinus TaxID=3034023 RepID=A0ABD5ZQI4_9EURY|nr:hypothetical protein [Halosegnis sp. DT85]